MSESRLESLDGELLELIEAERQRPGMPAEVQERLLGQLRVHIAGGSGGGGGPGPATSAGAARSGPLCLRQLLHGIPLAMAFALGGLTGAGLHAWLSRPAKVAIVPAIAPSPALLPVPGPATAFDISAPLLARGEPAPDRMPAPVVPQRRPAHKQRVQTTAAPVAERKQEPANQGASHDTELAAERALIEIARTAFTRGQGPAALEVLGRHEQQFPEGRLIEERESLLVMALVLAGRGDEARARGEKFRQRFPASLTWPVVEGALKSIR